LGLIYSLATVGNASSFFHALLGANDAEMKSLVSGTQAYRN